MNPLPRVAVTTGALRVPPTYFVLQHAALLGDRYEFEAFARVADIHDDALGIPVRDATPLGGPFARRARTSLAFGRRQARAIRHFGPALVHQHFGTWSEPAAAAARANGVPLVTTVHGYDVFATVAKESTSGGALQRYVDGVRRRSTLGAYAASARILAVSRYLADRAIDGGADAKKLAVHYLGVDTDYFQPTPRTASDEATIVFVGALTELKGPRDLLAASQQLALRSPHRLVYVGEGPLESELRRAAELAPDITFLGGRSRDEVREIIRGARALVLPTQLSGGRREAAGLVLLEAQALGVPVVTYASGGAPEMLLDGTTGIVVPESNVPALTDAVRELLELPDADYRRMSVAAREFVVRERSLTASARELDAHYRELIG